MDQATFLPALPIERRLALAYAPATSRGLWLGLFALDARLGGIVQAAHEPLLAQIKLAWWRDELAKPVRARALGEPLLALLAEWEEHGVSLRALIDGWERLLDDEPLDQAGLLHIAQARAHACAGLAAQLGLSAAEPAVRRAAHGWALAELGALRTAPEQQSAVLTLIIQHDWRRAALPRELRPLQVLYGLAARQRGAGPLLPGPVAALRAVRLGLLGI